MYTLFIFISSTTSFQTEIVHNNYVDSLGLWLNLRQIQPDYTTEYYSSTNRDSGSVK